tara:strand:- start:117371 stop:117556 length:186 start_codon:yes stop_codon:yes gene_type:complete
MDTDKKEVRFSMNHLTKSKMGDTTNGSIKSNRSTKRAQKKTNGKYTVKIVDGVKHMRLKDY